MKNRTDEYWALVRELSQPPQALEGSVSRARARARKSSLTRRLGAPAASLAAIAASFVLLVNVFPTFALACSGVPVIRELAAAVAFSPSLSAAVAHDYVQYIGQSQTANGVTLSLEYAIVDKHQAVFFYSLSETCRTFTSPQLTAADGTPIGGYATSSSFSGDQEGLQTLTLSFSAESSLPDWFTLELFLKPEPEESTVEQCTESFPAPAPEAPSTPSDTADRPEPSESLDPRQDPSALRFVFDVTLDPDRIAGGRILEVGRWVELDGQRVLVDRLELFPTRTVLYLGEDEANSAWLRSLKFWFEDGTGARYDDIDGSLSASGEVDSKSFLTYYFQSFYYAQPEGLTLCIGKAEWLEKNAPRAVIDLTTGEAAGLPQGMEITGVSRNGSRVAVNILEPLEYQGTGQLFLDSYRDPEGGEHFQNTWSYSLAINDEGEEYGVRETIFLEDYPWDTVELELSRTGVSVYEPPVRVALTP